MDPSDHGLEGYSAGGWFVVYALLTQPQAFRRYIAASAALSYCDGMLFDIEAQYAAEHDDLAAQLFLGVGGHEMTENHLLGCLSSTAQMVEILSFRDYPSLQLTAKIFAEDTHATSRSPTMAHGVRAVWGERFAPNHGA
jgi:predicted alpha/beta superfamily hydrolase